MGGAGRFVLAGVRVVLDEAVVLDGIDTALAEPGLTVLAGPSGSGKSTLLRLCNRLEVPSSGAVSFDGVDLDRLDPLTLRRRVGMVFQRPTVFDGTGRDNLRVACPEADDATLVSGLEVVGLDPVLLDRDARALSGGEAQRLCLARTLLTEPEVLLMDEPTSALDADSSALIECEARRIASADRPVLWVTHDLEQASRLADRVLVMVGGRLQSEAVTERCMARRSFVDPEDA